MNQLLHKEVQHIKQSYLVVLVTISALLPLAIIIFGLISQLYYEMPFGNNPMSDRSLIITAIIAAFFAVLVILLFKFSNLTVEVRSDGFYYKCFPFHLSEKKILIQDVKSVYIRNFSPIGEFGGWGIRFGFKKRGKAYIVSGKFGVQFILNDEKKVLFTTQEHEKMLKALEKVFISKTNSKV